MDPQLGPVAAATQPKSSIPRTSRIPLPRASVDNLKHFKSSNSTDGPNPGPASKPPTLRRPINYYTSQKRPAPSRKGNNTTSIAYSQLATSSKDGIFKKPTARPTSHDCPVPSIFAGDNLSTSSVNDGSHTSNDQQALEALSDSVITTEEDVFQLRSAVSDMRADKRRPRPSLSDRTIETLSQIPPSPASGRRKSNFFSAESPMSIPARSLANRSSNPTLSLGPNISRSSIPSKRPPSPSKRPPVPPLPQTLTVTAFEAARPSTLKVRPCDSARPKAWADPPSVTKHIARGDSISTTKAKAFPGHSLENSKLVLHRGSKTLINRPRQSRPSFTSIFKRPPETPSLTGTLDVLKTAQTPNASHSRAQKGESFSSSTSSSIASVGCSAGSAISPCTEPDLTEDTVKVLKSSAALREIIVKAKAAQRSAQSSTAPPLTAGEPRVAPAVDTFLLPPHDSDNQKALLHRRLASARLDGNLNIAALELQQIPDEVMKMYDFDPSSNTSWAETVDMVKFVAADNELTEIREDAFPDCTYTECMEDEKANQFGGLKTLDLHGNMLRTIPIGIRRLERLYSLNLSNNALCMDVFKVICQIDTLVDLHVAGNQIEGALPAEICRLIDLQFLDLHSNAIDSLPESVQLMVNLRVLNIAQNRLSELPVASFTDMRLVEIDASKNKLTGTFLPAAVNCLESLQTLDLSFNSLDQLAETATVEFPNLRTLTLDGNRLHSLPDMSSWTRLLTCTASANRLRAVPDGFVELMNLKNADFGGNHINKLDVRIGHMHTLMSLNITANPLRDRRYLAMTTDDVKQDMRSRCGVEAIENFFDAFESHSFVGNAGIDQSEGHGRWETENGLLDLTSRSLADIDPSRVNLDHSISALKLSHNKLASFPIQILTTAQIAESLKSLDMSSNALGRLETDLALLHLQSLNLAFTSLTTVDNLKKHLTSPELRELDISHNHIGGPLPNLRDHFPALTTLHAANNMLKTIEIEAVRGLHLLDVRNNEIESLPSQLGMLAGNDGLRMLEVSGNKLRVPRREILEKGTESILRYLRGRIPVEELDSVWKDERLI